MSLIDDALKRAESEKLPPQTPSYIEPVPVVAPAAEPAPSLAPRSRTPLLLGLLVLAAAAAIGWKLLGHSSPMPAPQSAVAAPAAPAASAAVAATPAPTPASVVADPVVTRTAGEADIVIATRPEATAPGTPAATKAPTAEMFESMIARLGEVRGMPALKDPAEATRLAKTINDGMEKLTTAQEQDRVKVEDDSVVTPPEPGELAPSPTKVIIAATPAPAPSATPAVKGFDANEYKLSGVMINDEGGMAIINGRFIRQGQMVDGAKLIRVSNRYVELEFHGRKYNISMQ